MTNKSGLNKNQIHELLYQALETELGGEKLYVEALKCAKNEDLREEWQTYLEETKTHQQVLMGVFEEMGLDPQATTDSQKVVGFLGDSLVEAIQLAIKAGDKTAAQLVAAECVVLAETKDHLNWELIGHVAEAEKGDAASVLKRACEAVEDQEDHHLYHTRGFLRELWLDALGLPAVLPPPEEVKDVKTAIGAARAEHARREMM